jgi:hypothetical protein
VVPGTADGLTHDEALREGPAVVATCGANGEHLGTTPHKDHTLPLDVPEEGAPILQAIEGNARPEVGALRFGLLVAHVDLTESI